MNASSMTPLHNTDGEEGLFSRIKRRLRHSGTQADTLRPKVDAELTKLIEKTKADLEFWHRTFRTFSVVPCAYCGKQMRIYPYGGAYYTIKDNRKVHAECYDKYLAQRNDLQPSDPEANKRPSKAQARATRKVK